MKLNYLSVMSVVEKYSHSIWTTVHIQWQHHGDIWGEHLYPQSHHFLPLFCTASPSAPARGVCFLSPVNVVLTVISSRVISTLARLQWSHSTSRCLLWRCKFSESGQWPVWWTEIRRRLRRSSYWWQHWRRWVTGCKEVDGCKRWFRQRSLVPGQRTPSCGHPMSVEPGGHIRLQQQHCRRCSGRPTTTTLSSVTNAMRSWNLMIGASSKQRRDPISTTGQPSCNWSWRF